MKIMKKLEAALAAELERLKQEGRMKGKEEIIVEVKRAAGSKDSSISVKVWNNLQKSVSMLIANFLPQFSQLGGSPAHRHVGQASGHCPPGRPLRPAHLAEGILQADGHAALDHRPLRRQEPAHRGQSQGLQAQEDRQIRAADRTQ